MQARSSRCWALSTEADWNPIRRTAHQLQLLVYPFGKSKRVFCGTGLSFGLHALACSAFMPRHARCGWVSSQTLRLKLEEEHGLSASCCAVPFALSVPQISRELTRGLCLLRLLMSLT
ncbi:hypothetical protein SISSUDRAFT_127947 [Sistotremastrum suecicum HHB10207 ss-3]|uniref:Uncharacterized protein n=1 Tax=Sistotremastrum suecicum HHB10207 ss-3 TaxID=1314776 RepID=A0A166AYD5_9AGAM|nr:hypothetical protein SISSUDRAFT_127947 [Sistotremastrum suecicum HHB10207 ss-3]